MDTISPMRGWRYDPGRVDPAKVTAPPYDVIDEAEQGELYARDEYNVVRLILGRTFPDDHPRNNRYVRAAAHLGAWREEGVFIEDRPSVYVYEQNFVSGGRECSRRGFFAKVRLSEWGREGIYPHEKTLSGPKQDRLDLMRATRGNLEPIFGLLADPGGEVSATLSGLADYSPCLNVKDGGGVVNRMWVVDGEDRLRRLLDRIRDPRIFIADGHHRYETALAYRDEVREKMRRAGQEPPPLGGLDCDHILMFIVPDSDPGLVIWPTHRVIHGLKGFSADDFLKRCEGRFDVSEADPGGMDAALAGEGLPCFGFVGPEGSRLLRLRDRRFMAERHPGACEAWRVLDVSVLHSLLLEDILGIDEGKLLRKENILYSRRAPEVAERVRSGRDGAQCGFILRATPMRQVRDIAEAGAVMPQKSTYFHPKPLSGAVFRFFW